MAGEATAAASAGRPLATIGQASFVAATSLAAGPSAAFRAWLTAMRSSRWSLSAAVLDVLPVPPPPPPPHPAAVNTAAPISRGRAAVRTALTQAGGIAPPTVRALDAEEVDHEHERRIRRDRGRAALGAVGFARRDDELAPPADFHSRHTVVPE